MVRTRLVERWWIRGIVVLAFALWQGGFTFYTGIVVPTGTAVLGSPAAQGFITQRVTDWLNVVGMATLGVLLVHLLLVRAAKGPWRGLLITWLILTLGQIILLALHPALDSFLTAEPQRVHDAIRFRPWHRLYLHVSTAMWVAGLLHLGFLLFAWQRLDRQIHAISGFGSTSSAVE